MKLGFGELLIIFVVILFIIGPDKIPSFAKKLGEGLRAFRSATSDVTKEIKENVVDPLNEAQAPLREAMEPLTEMKEEINKSVRDIKKDVAGLNNVNAPKKTIEVGESAPEEVKTAAAAISRLGGSEPALTEVDLPGVEGKRWLVSIPKTSPTPSGYPRRTGLPLKKPILQ